ncbi:hypothetical protein [Haloferula sp.]|uniref:hypothetical protein n=1 Tax=Haloferula sp. TaxID=2497595 RepID=UPI003C720F0C
MNKSTQTRHFPVLLIPALVGILHTQASAQNLVNAGTADWATAPWSGGSAPTAGDTSFFNGDNTITIQSGTNAVASVLRLGDSGVVSSSLTLSNGGSLAVTNSTNVANAADSNFFLNLAGTFTSGPLFIGGSNTTDTAGTAQVTISGGSVTLSSFIQFSLGTGTSATRLIVDGDATTSISATQIQFAGGGNNPGQLRYNMAEFGITPISLSGSVFGAENLDLLVDGSGYIGGPGKFTLIDTDTDLSGGDSVYGTFNSITLDFADQGLSASVAVENGDLVLTLAQQVDGNIRVYPDTVNDELTLTLGFESSTDLTNFTDIDLTGATLQLDPSDPTKLQVIISDVAESRLFIRLNQLD